MQEKIQAASNAITNMGIWDLFTKIDGISTIVSGIAIFLIAAGRVIWWWFSKRKKSSILNTEDARKPSEYEIVNESYLELIKALREEVDRLRGDVDELANLKLENLRQQGEINELREMNHQLEEENKLCRVEIASLKTKVNKLIRGKKRNKSGKLPV